MAIFTHTRMSSRLSIPTYGDFTGCYINLSLPEETKTLYNCISKTLPFASCFLFFFFLLVPELSLLPPHVSSFLSDYHQIMVVMVPIGNRFRDERLAVSFEGRRGMQC